MPAGSETAIQIAIKDRGIQAYLQRYPFAIGDSFDLNRTALGALREGLFLRRGSTACEVEEADVTHVQLTLEEHACVRSWLERLQANETEQRFALEFLLWKVARIPRATRTVLSMGCAAGVELILMRALLPEAKLVAVDFDDVVSPATKRALNLEFTQGHFNEFLFKNGERFDVVFCNHVLEHLFEPEETLGLLRRCLKPGGSLIAALPMEGYSEGLFTRTMRRMATNPGALHILDIGVLDAGHPWKTNPPDLRSTLEHQGFDEIELYVRKTRNGLGGTLARRLGLVLYAASFGFARKSLRHLSPSMTPNKMVWAFLAAERRCWFGANRLKNRFATEVLVQAKVAVGHLGGRS